MTLRRDTTYRLEPWSSAIISLFGGGCGFLFAVWGVPVLVALAPSEVPRLQEVGINWSTFGFTFGISAGVGITCGLLACLSARKVPPSLLGSMHAATTPGTSWFRHGVTVCEVGLALMLAVAASLMVRTVRALEAIDVGFDPSSVVSAELSSRYGGQDLRSTIVERVKSLPGVQAAGIGLGPLEGGMSLGGLICPPFSRSRMRFEVLPQFC